MKNWEKALVLRLLENERFSILQHANRVLETEKIDITNHALFQAQEINEIIAKLELSKRDLEEQ